MYSKNSVMIKILKIISTLSITLFKATSGRIFWIFVATPSDQWWRNWSKSHYTFNMVRLVFRDLHEIAVVHLFLQTHVRTRVWPSYTCAHTRYVHTWLCLTYVRTRRYAQARTRARTHTTNVRICRIRTHVHVALSYSYCACFVRIVSPLFCRRDACNMSRTCASYRPLSVVRKK